MADIQLSVKDLQKTFHPGLFEASIEVLKGLSFEVARGEIFGFLGPNGAGKTTTIKAITEIIYPDAGEITVCGLPHTSLEAKKRIGFMSESPYIYRHLTGREYLWFGGELLGLDRAGLADRISRVLDQVGMSGRADRTMGTYSKGMLQRVALGQALLGEPELLILDEPMSGLDPVGRRDVRDIILNQAAAGVGRVRAIGTVSELISDETTGYEATFVGALPADLRTPLEAYHVASGASWVRVTSENRDNLIHEFGDRGIQVVSLDPVRTTLEDLLMRHYEESGS
ncbi:MAG: ABC transporter ATP-binding protein [Acidobacteria bacterium]|uniref:ABC transporter ATP-binding protein n=1 Tax=Candidatus Sulfomarinibacter kjeldsenii TaxID=2885994 RepID=A0A8J6Y4K6_9BACT|nr:ABC transporter ATP-binding protein [Candidatus Sulfomarinibacter kjeldsenii]